MNHKSLVYSVFFAGALALLPAVASAASFDVSGWLPYWRGATSTNDVIPHLSELTEVNPFVYTLKSDGTLLDNAPMSDPAWQTLVQAARAQNVRVVPTIMTADGDLVHDLLSDSAKRVALEDYLTAFVNQNNFDGIEIDFEGKKASDKDNFSLFLKGLYQRMGNKFVECDIEARTPPDSKYYGTDIPADAGVYANDFSAINAYCDRVKIMAYDQQGDDRMESAKADAAGVLYAPVADPTWVEKVINLTAQTISKSKIMIGIPTYGYEYAVTAYANNQYQYDILWTFNPGYATQTATEYNVLPYRTPWGEMALTHIKDGDATSTRPVSLTPFAGLAAAAAATQYATSNNSHVDFRMLVWPDAQSIKDKVDLAKRLGVRGVAIFKMDGGEDPNMWTILQGAKQAAPVDVVQVPPSTVTPPSTIPSPSPVPTTVFTRTLRLGSSGADVRALQRVLNADPDTRVASSGVGSPGRENTNFGPATLAAVKRFQVKYGIARKGQAGYGLVGPATRAKLNSL